MAKVELKGIGKVYDGNVRAVDNANITVNDQEFVVFVGPSGCGKSTTLRMIAGLEAHRSHWPPSHHQSPKETSHSSRHQQLQKSPEICWP